MPHQSNPAAVGRSGDAVATFLQRLADGSEAPSSLLGELAPGEGSNERREEGLLGKDFQEAGIGTTAPGEQAPLEEVALPAVSKKRHQNTVADWRNTEGAGAIYPAISASSSMRGYNGEGDGDIDSGTRVGFLNRDLDSTTGEEASGRHAKHTREQTRPSAPGSTLGVNPSQYPPSPMSPPQSTPRLEPLHLVLFARAKGRPFVYCGIVDCIGQDYVPTAGSSRLGAVKLTLALREWREAAAVSEADGEALSRRGVDSGGEVYARAGGVYAAEASSWGGSIRLGENIDGFLDVVRAGLRP